MPRIDMSAWTDRAKTFVESIPKRVPKQFRWWSRKGQISVEVGPPATEPQIARAEAALECALPPILRDLYLETNGFDASYTLEMPHDTPVLIALDYQSFWGNVTFPSLDSLAAENKMNRDIAVSEPEHWTFLDGRMCFMPLANGDALFVDADHDDPPVHYVAHSVGEESSRFTPLASSLSRFLTEWEKLYYFGPEWWLLDGFVYDGELRADGDGFQALKEFFEQKK